MAKQDIIERAKRVSLSSNPKDYIEFVGELAKENETIQEDVQEAANQYIGYPPEVDEGVSTSMRRHAYADGMLAERERLMNEAVEVNVSNDGILQMGSILTDRGIGADQTIKLIILK